MIALLRLDIAQQRKTVLLSLLAGAAVCAIGWYQGHAAIVIAPACAYLAVMLISISYNGDVADKFHHFLFSTPIRPRAYIAAKLLYAVAFGAFGAVLMLAALLLDGSLSAGMAVLIALLVQVYIVVLAAFQMVFLVKFGVDKGKLIAAITYILFLAGMSALKRVSGTVDLSWLRGLSGTALCLGALAVGVVFGAGCVRAAVSAMERKEY